jgi:hypothetical protein
VVERKPRNDGPPDAFTLFCSYYLGITPDDGYQRPTLEDTARRLGVTSDVIKQLLVEYNLTPETVHNSSFDLSGAQLDIRVAPMGISRTEIAREIYEEFRATLEG